MPRDVMEKALATPASPPPSPSSKPSSITSESPAPNTPDLPPDGGYGWTVVLAIFLLNSSTWGINSTYGVFLAHYLSTSTFTGTPLQYSFIGGLSISTSMLLSPLVTTLLRLTSTRTVLLAGTTLTTLSLLTSSFATNIAHLFITQGLIFGAGIGFLFIGSVGIVSQWFLVRRSVANGIAAGGSGFGGLVYSLGVRAMLTRIGLPWTFRVLALCVFVVCATCTLLIRDRNTQVQTKQNGFDLKLLRRLELWGVLAWGWFSMLGYVVVLFSLPDYARSMGYSVSQGGILSAVLNAGMMLGRPAVGLASDRYGRLNVGCGMTLVTAVSCAALWVPVRTFAGVCVFAVLCGAVCGTFWTTVAPITVEVVGIRELPSALSWVWLGIVLPTTFSMAVGLSLRREELGRDGAYMWPQVFASCMYTVAFGCLWAVRAWKLGMEDGEGEKGVGVGRWGSANRWWRWTLV